MIKIVGRNDPEPADLILSYAYSDGLDYFEGTDKLTVAEQLEAIGSRFAVNFGFIVMCYGALAFVLCWIIGFIMGEPVNPGEIIPIILCIGGVSGLGVLAGVYWVVGAYREAVQVAIHE